MKVLAISDTHVETIEELIWLQHVILPFVSEADMILHAGDASIPEVTNHLSGLRPTHFVCGEHDRPPVRWSTPSTDIITAGDFKIGLVHARHGMEELAHLIDGSFAGVDAIVYGHTHQPFVGEINNVMVINPGSPTCEDASPRNTIAMIEAESKIEARILDVIRPVPHN